MFSKTKLNNVLLLLYFLPDNGDTNQLASLRQQVLAFADCQPSLCLLMPVSAIVAGQVVNRPAKNANDTLESPN